MPSAYYEAYVREQRRIRQLLESLDCLPDDAQQLAIRGATVLIVAEFEALIRDVVQDRLDRISESWDAMLPAERRTMVRRVVAELADVLESARDREPDARAGERIIGTIRRLGAWADEHGRFARDVPTVTLPDFYDPSRVAHVLERVLVELRDDGMPFFNWLGSRGADMSSYRLSLQSLLGARADAAHQLRGGLTMTVPELREHQRRLAAMARAVRSYASGSRQGVRQRSGGDGG